MFKYLNEVIIHKKDLTQIFNSAVLDRVILVRITSQRVNMVYTTLWENNLKLNFDW